MTETVQMVQNIAYSDMDDDVWIVEKFEGDLVKLLNPMIDLTLQASYMEFHTITKENFYKRFEDEEHYRAFSLHELRPLVRHLLMLHIWDDIKY